MKNKKIEMVKTCIGKLFSMDQDAPGRSDPPILYIACPYVQI